MKHLLVFLPLAALSAAQRPTYAGISPKGYPDLATRFKDSVENVTDVNAGIANRLGEETSQPQNIPTDARGDVSLVNRLNQWPRENRPFWLLNTQQLEKHRHPVDSVTTPQSRQQNSGLNEANVLNGNQSDGAQIRQIQSRFGEGSRLETKTIKPQSQKGSFAGGTQS